MNKYSIYNCGFDKTDKPYFLLRRLQRRYKRKGNRYYKAIDKTEVRLKTEDSFIITNPSPLDRAIIPMLFYRNCTITVDGNKVIITPTLASRNTRVE